MLSKIHRTQLVIWHRTLSRNYVILSGFILNSFVICNPIILGCYVDNGLQIRGNTICAVAHNFQKKLGRLFSEDVCYHQVMYQQLKRG